VTEAEAAAIRAAFEQGGEFAAQTAGGDRRSSSSDDTRMKLSDAHIFKARFRGELQAR
jgi:hypothetical protein